MSSPAERELLPGIYITDFRTPESIAESQATTAAGGQTVEGGNTAIEEKEKQRAESDEKDGAPPAASVGASVGSSGSTSGLTRSAPSTFPADIPNDIESLELELEALMKNLQQLLKSNDILQHELLESPDDSDFLDAIRENRTVIARRNERMKAIQQELKLIAPHRMEVNNQELADAIEAELRRDAPTTGTEEEGGIFL